MKNKIIKPDELKFQYKLIEVKKISYFENDIEKYQFKDKVKRGNTPFQLTVHIAIDDSSGTIDVILRIKFYYMNNNEKIELFGIDTSHKFKIKNFFEVFLPNDKKEYPIPDEVMTNFLGIAISGTRGMLIVVNTNKQYENILLPLINPLEVLKHSKGKSK